MASCPTSDLSPPTQSTMRSLEVRHRGARAPIDYPSVVAPLPAPMDEAHRPLSPDRPSRLAEHYVHDSVYSGIDDCELAIVGPPPKHLPVPFFSWHSNSYSDQFIIRYLVPFVIYTPYTIYQRKPQLSHLTCSRYEEPAHVKPIDGFKGWFNFLCKTLKCMLLSSPRS